MVLSIPMCQANTRNSLMLGIPTRARRGVKSVEIQSMWKAFQCPAKKFQCTACHKFGHFTSLCYQKKQAPFKSMKSKAHALQAGSVYAKESAICSQFETYSWSDDSFSCRSKCSGHKLISRRFPSQPTDNKCSLQIEDTSYKTLISKSKTGYLYRCQQYACQCV